MKAFLYSALFLFSLSAFSQDIIITKEGKSIKTKIIELTSEKVSYKKYDYQDGATIILELSKVRSIVWENGDVDDFDKEEPKGNQTQNNVQINNTDLPTIIDRNKGIIYFENDTHMDYIQFKSFLLENNMTNIWTMYHNGNRLFSAGQGMLMGGILLEIAGGILIYSSIQNSGIGYGINERGVLIGGCVAASVGFILEVVSIPTMIIGGTKRAKAIDNYNEKIQVRYSYQPTLKIGTTNNGIGIIFNF
jgi:hypothetical protein